MSLPLHVSFDFAQQHHIIPDDGNLMLGPGACNAALLVQLQQALGTQCQVINLSQTEFDQKLQTYFSDNTSQSVSAMADMDELLSMEAAAHNVEHDSDLLSGKDDAPVIKLMNAILMEALNDKVSDIHIEMYESKARIRFRLDGVLKTVLSPSIQVAPLLISRIKVMAKLDIAEKRLPQDGRMSIKLGGRAVDLRISTLPSGYGERVVMRLLDKQGNRLQLSGLGMDPIMLSQLDELIKRPHGIVLVTGPTGSGKTTTLYAALEHLDRQTLNIMTVEDPIEYNLNDISQTQINIRAGMTFAKGLRAILRQDPDVILIGEIRDAETAEIAIQASLTGHLVFATLHTNSASGAVSRLQDLGVDSLLLASALRGVLAQRLVRKLCDSCKTSYDITEALKIELNNAEDTQIYTHVACSECHFTGFNGRIGLYELASIDEGLQKLIHDQAGDNAIERYIRKQTPSILEAGYTAVNNGLTTMEEVLRVTSR